MGRGVSGKEEERKGNSRFLERWLGDRGGGKEVRRSPERAREVKSEEEERTQEGKEKAGGRIIVPEAEKGRSPQEGKRFRE